MPTSKRFLILLFTFLIPAAALTGCSPTTQAAGYFPPSARTKITCIIQRESGGDPTAISPTQDYGILQLNRAAHATNFYNRYHLPFTTYALTVKYNAMYGRYLYDYYRAHGGSGFEPWNGGRYPC